MHVIFTEVFSFLVTKNYNNSHFNSHVHKSRTSDYCQVKYKYFKIDILVLIFSFHNWIHVIEDKSIPILSTSLQAVLDFNAKIFRYTSSIFIIDCIIDPLLIYMWTLKNNKLYLPLTFFCYMIYINLSNLLIYFGKGNIRIHLSIVL